MFGITIPPESSFINPLNIIRQKSFIDFGKLEVGKESKAWKNLWGAGESAATIKDSLPTGALIKRMEKECKVALQEQAALMKRYTDK